MFYLREESDRERVKIFMFNFFYLAASNGELIINPPRSGTNPSLS